ncbi:MAG: DMT family transporter [Candidatus Heimdallarchaeota archaeon]|nr:DMT family transporter [Candidatus Heimdallarchaeota archaeon]MCK5144155.1 DMT family transporter [Candidatus Heimdallarchaeota archaeon]
MNGRDKNVLALYLDITTTNILKVRELNKKIIHLLKASTVVLGWSLTPVVGDYLIDQKAQLSPYQLAFFRYFIAAVALFVILQFQKDFENKQIITSLKNKWKAYILVSITAAGMPVLLFVAVKNPATDGSSASFLLNANIILIPIVAFFILREKIRKSYAIALSISLVGLFLVIFDESLFDIGNFTLGSISGNLLAFGSGFCWALYTVLLKKYFSEDNPLLVTFLSLLMGSFYLVFFAFLIPPIGMSLDFLGIFLVIVIAVLSTSLAYSFWLDILGYLSTTQTGMIQALVPLLSVVWAVSFFGDSVTYIFGIGAVLIITSMIIVETRRKEQPEMEN